MKVNNLWIIILEDNRKFEIVCKKQETAINKIEKYYLNDNDILVPSHLKDIYIPLYPNKNIIGYKVDMRGILTI